MSQEYFNNVLSRKNLVIIGVTFLFGCCVFLFSNSYLNGAQSSSIEGQSASTSGEANQLARFGNDIKSHADVLNPVAKNQEKMIEWPTKNIDEEKLAHQEVLKWRFTRGWYDPNQADDYQTYSRETLLKLADDGDIHAMHLLTKSSSESERIKLMQKAAIYGSTFAFEVLANNLKTDISMNEKLTLEEKKQKLIDAAAYKRVEMLRGDHFEYFSDELANLENRYSIKFSTDDREKIEDRAKEVYSELELRREQLGLGKFDNSVPPIVQAFYRFAGYN